MAAYTIVLHLSLPWAVVMASFIVSPSLLFTVLVSLVFCRPLDRLPNTIPVNKSFSMHLCLIMCPMNWSFCSIWLTSPLYSPISSSMLLFDLLSVRVTLNNLLYTHLCFQSKDLSRVNEALNEDLSRLDALLVSNKLSLNVAKTKSMLVSTKAKRKTLNKSNQNLQVNINGTELEVVSKIKLLGVLLDNSLDWKEQIQAVSLKVSRGLGILKHAKKFLPFSALTSLYTSIVEPHFRYCCSVWGCAGTTEINRLQKLQNRAARIVTNSSFDTPSNQLIEKLGWKTINELIDIESKTMVFKTLNELAPPYLCSLFRKNSQSTSYRLRNTSTDLRLPKKGTENGKKCFSFRGMKLWNSLSANCKQAASLSTFKHLVIK